MFITHREFIVPSNRTPVLSPTATKGDSTPSQLEGEVDKEPLVPILIQVLKFAYKKTLNSYPFHDSYDTILRLPNLFTLDFS